MLANYQSSLTAPSQRDNILHAIQYTTNYNFYLTGSRFFGTNHPTSDYDFFVEGNPQCGTGLVSFLTELGFKETRVAKYSDSSILSLYRWRSDDGKGSVDVQIVNDAELKHIAQGIILKHDMLSRRDKDMARNVWNNVMLTVKEMRDAAKLDQQAKESIMDLSCLHLRDFICIQHDENSNTYIAEEYKNGQHDYAWFLKRECDLAQFIRYLTGKVFPPRNPIPAQDQ